MQLLFKSVVNTYIHTITCAMQGLGHVALENATMISQRIFRSIAMCFFVFWIFMVIYGVMLIE